MLIGGAGKESINLTHGSSSQIRDIKVMNINATIPLDYQFALDMMKGNKSVYYMILNKFRN